MTRIRPGLFVIRLLPVLLVTTAAMVYVAHVEGRDAYVFRNIAPMLVVIALLWCDTGALSGRTLYNGGGSWTRGGLHWVLGTLGFAIPALGLSIYLHYGYTVNLHGMFDDAVYPLQLFRFLPGYTIVAGAVGFAIGWIVGRNL